MLTQYLASAMETAKYEILSDSHEFYGEIPGFDGILATGETLEGCRRQLAEVLEEWVLVRVSLHLSLPQVNGISLSVSEVA